MPIKTLTTGMVVVKKGNKPYQDQAQSFSLEMIEQGLTFMEGDQDAASTEELRKAWEHSMQQLVVHVGSLYQRFQALPPAK